MKLSVIVPVYNEAQNIEALVEKVVASPVDKEIILVDDASTDGTVDIIRNKILPKHGNIRFFRHEKNKGKGSAIRTGLPQAVGEVVIIQDADLEYDPQDYVQILRKFRDPKISVVYGTRFWKVNRHLFIWHWFCNRFLGAHYEIRYLHHFLGILLLNFLANILYSANITDEATCYKAFRRKVLEKIHLRCEGFEFCPEVTAKILKKGIEIYEVPSSYRPRTRKEGKKIKFRDWVQAVCTLIKYRIVD